LHLHKTVIEALNFFFAKPMFGLRPSFYVVYFVVISVGFFVRWRPFLHVLV